MSGMNETQKKTHTHVRNKRKTHACETRGKHQKKNTHTHVRNEGKTQTRAKLARNTYMSEKHAYVRNERKIQKKHTRAKQAKNTNTCEKSKKTQ